MRLAVLNEDNICTGYKMVKYMIEDGKHVEIDNGDYLYRKYENGQWSEEKYLPLESDQPTIEEQILFETQYQTVVLEILSLGGI